MTGFVKRSLLQVVAAVVLFASAGASDVFADTSHIVAAVTYGNVSKAVVGKFYHKVTNNGMHTWQQVLVNYNPPERDGTEYFNISYIDNTLLYPQYYKYHYATSLSILEPGLEYKVEVYTRTGASPNYTYTSLGTDSWTQP